MVPRSEKQAYQYLRRDIKLHRNYLQWRQTFLRDVIAGGKDYMQYTNAAQEIQRIRETIGLMDTLLHSSKIGP
jgi:hypothetical protein